MVKGEANSFKKQNPFLKNGREHFYSEATKK